MGRPGPATPPGPFTKNSFRRPQSATLMRFNTRRTTFLYGKISRIRAISSPQVLAAAEQVLRRIRSCGAGAETHRGSVF